MASFGISTVLAWDLDALASLGTDLSTHSQDLRQCFFDFRGSSDLSTSWRGDAADASTRHADDLATDLYDLSDMIGLMAAQLGRRQADLVECRTAIVKARNEAEDNELHVADDGTVTAGSLDPEAPSNADIPPEKTALAKTLTATLTAAVRNAAAADIDLARALRDAENTVLTHAKDPEIVVEAVDYVPPIGPLLPGVSGDDPFLTDVNILGPVVPQPGDVNFQMYWDALTPEERAMAAHNWGGLPTGFNPFKGVQGGQLPNWAQVYNLGHNGGLTTDSQGNEVIGAGYGYLGGGTILGPGGKQWPIVSPYYSDGKHVYLQDSGVPRADGGIDQLDGSDPGWHTVESYVGPGSYGTVSDSTKSLIVLENTTGQDLEVNPTDSGNISIGPDGRPELGAEGHDGPEVPYNKAYWDVSAPDDPNEPFNQDEAAKGAESLGIQAGNSAVQVQNADSHTAREYQVSYQVNDDGRVRAVVNTYTSGPNGDGGGTNVGGFSTSFPDGQHGSASEVPIDVRDNPLTVPHTSAVPDPNVHYLGDSTRNGGTLDNTKILHEKLDR